MDKTRLEELIKNRERLEKFATEIISKKEWFVLEDHSQSLSIREIKRGFCSNISR